MRLVPETPAPSFSVRSLQGEDCGLSTYAGQLTWIAFFRYATCPLCNLRVHQLVIDWPKLKGRVNLVAVFQSPPERFEGYISKYDPPFPVVSDAELQLFKLYKVEESVLAAMSASIFPKMMAARKEKIPLFDGPRDGGALRVPADFLIDRQGVLKLCRYGKNIGDSIPTPDVEAFLVAQGV